MFKKFCFVVLCCISVAANAVSATGQVVADDFYSVYVGNATGTDLTKVNGSGTATTWQGQGALFNFNVDPGQYIYVAAWDSADFGPPHAWIGQFNVGASTLLSNTTDWVSKFQVNVKDPTVGQVTSLIQDGSSWGGMAASMPNGSSPYGSRIGGSPASFVWHDSFGGASASESGYALFRTNVAAVAAVPEPETYALLLAGLGVMGFVARRRKQV
jgi:hypothetical protein